MINSGRRPVAAFPRLIPPGRSRDEERPVKKSRWTKFIRCMHTGERSTCARNDTARLVVNARQRSWQGSSELVFSFFRESRKTYGHLWPIPRHRNSGGVSIVSVGRATDSYEFGWHPVLNKSRTLSGRKIYGTELANVRRNFILAKILFLLSEIECENLFARRSLFFSASLSCFLIF